MHRNLKCGATGGQDFEWGRGSTPARTATAYKLIFPGLLLRIAPLQLLVIDSLCYDHEFNYMKPAPKNRRNGLLYVELNNYLFQLNFINVFIIFNKNISQYRKTFVFYDSSK